MQSNLNLKPINFQFGEYISKGFELLKNNFGNVFVGFLVVSVMSIIPFCSLLALGNYYKYLKKLSENKPASVGEIFDFENFSPYFILQLIIIAGVFALFIPFIIFGGFAAIISDGGNSDASPLFAFMMFPYFFIIMVLLYYFMIKGFYIPALISLKGVKSIKEAWNMSKVMSKGNLLFIFLFVMVINAIAQIGILACGIGILVTLPFMYTANYFAFDDAIQQIEYDEITEIGIEEKY